MRLKMPDDRPLRILHLMLATDPGGLSRYVIDLSRALAARGHETIVAADAGPDRHRFLDQPLRLIDIPLRQTLGIIRSSRLLQTQLQGTPIDLIHTHYRRATLLGRRLQRTLKSPILYTVHLSHISLRFPRNLFTDFGDHTHIASEDARPWCVNDGHVPAGQITCIPHGIDTDRFSPPTEGGKVSARSMLQLDEDATVAAYVGRLEDPKNEAWLLDLAAATRAQLPRLRVVFAGDGPKMPAVRSRIDQENLHDRVRVLGEIDPRPLYHAADALLLPSAREGFSLVCGEAMACGVPVLRTRTSGSAEMIVEGVTGRSTPIARDAFLAAAVDFLRDPARLTEMGRRARAHICANLTFGQQVSRTLDLYRRMSRLSSPSSGTPGEGPGRSSSLSSD